MHTIFFSPEHVCWLHLCASRESPLQNLPPCAGRGLSHDRDLLCKPPPQGMEHLVHGDHSDHLPSATRIINEIKLQLMNTIVDTIATHRNVPSMRYSDVIVKNTVIFSSLFYVVTQQCINHHREMMFNKLYHDFKW